MIALHHRSILFSSNKTKIINEVLSTYFKAPTTNILILYKLKANKSDVESPNETKAIKPSLRGSKREPMGFPKDVTNYESLKAVSNLFESYDKGLRDI